MDKELLKTLVNLRIIEGLLNEAAKEIKELTNQMTEYFKKQLKEE